VGRRKGSREVVGGGIGRLVCTRSLTGFLSALTGGSCSYEQNSITPRRPVAGVVRAR
jgi:hypothetical protein